MNQTYDTAYQAAVDAMIAEGMDVFLLNGGAVRARQGRAMAADGQSAKNAGTAPAMGDHLVQALRNRCHGTLAVSDGSAEQLIKTVTSRANARSAV